PAAEQRGSHRRWLPRGSTHRGGDVAKYARRVGASLLRRVPSGSPSGKPSGKSQVYTWPQLSPSGKEKCTLGPNSPLREEKKRCTPGPNSPQGEKRRLDGAGGPPRGVPEAYVEGGRPSGREERKYTLGPNSPQGELG